MNIGNPENNPLYVHCLFERKKKCDKDVERNVKALDSDCQQQKYLYVKS